MCNESDSGGPRSFGRLVRVFFSLESYVYRFFITIGVQYMEDVAFEPVTQKKRWRLSMIC